MSEASAASKAAALPKLKEKHQDEIRRLREALKDGEYQRVEREVSQRLAEAATNKPDLMLLMLNYLNPLPTLF